MISAEQVSEILGVVASGPGVDAVWVFGSEAKGTASDASDVDIAALFVRTPTLAELLDLQARLEAALRRPVDLVDLDRAGPALKHQVLKHGRLLLDRAPARRIWMAMLLPSQLEDLRIFQAPIIAAIKRRMLHGR